ncbi:MAG: carboxypeptidase M32 [Deltaproteobacteria bacterium]|nr:carboxypeptidase M32 [Deltaproteobacteria bacterium]
MVLEFEKFKSYYKDIFHLKSIVSLLYWDQRVYLPTRSFGLRSNQIKTIKTILHYKLTDRDYGLILSRLFDKINQEQCDTTDKSMILNAKREYDRSVRLPIGFVQQTSEHFTSSYAAWINARQQNDFKIVLPYLEKTIRLSQQHAEYFPEFNHPVDSLIDEWDYGFTNENLKPIFSDLKENLVPLARKIIEIKSRKANITLPKSRIPRNKQIDFTTQLAKDMGFDFERGRIDTTTHPFCTEASGLDTRIATNVDENNLFRCLFAGMHEIGHGLYEQGINLNLEKTPLHNSHSLGLHESQSRLWENIIGRGLPFWEFYFPILQNFFSPVFDKFSLEDIYDSVNFVTNTPIRVTADEVTYNLHIIIRRELECLLLEGHINPKNLPEAWNALYKKYLNIEIKNDLQGVLQDVHWYSNFMGGLFQSYTLGNLLSVQIYNAMYKSFADLSNTIRKGNLKDITHWLTKNIHSHGGIYSVDEILQEVTGDKLKTQPLIDYLNAKYL